MARSWAVHWQTCVPKTTARRAGGLAWSFGPIRLRRVGFHRYRSATIGPISGADGGHRRARSPS